MNHRDAIIDLDGRCSFTGFDSCVCGAVVCTSQDQG